MFGTSVLTSVTAQNTTGVHAIHDVPTEIIAAQIDAVMKDIKPDAVKTGMISTRGIIETVVDSVKKHDIKNLVVDPVMVAESGGRLLRNNAETSVIEKLLPVSYLVTPNVFEAEIISNIQIENMDDAKKAAEIIQKKGPDYVLLKGGRLHEEKSIDVLFDGNEHRYFEAEKVDTKNTHGTGCTLSAAITACLSKK